MARPLSKAKHNAILDAATQIIATEGVSAPTLRIAKVAGVSEGSFFTYFTNKDALLNELYIGIKRELAEAMMAGYPEQSEAAEKARHVWLNYVQWGVAHPDKCKAMAQLSVSDRVTPESRKAAMEPLAEIDRLLRECAGDTFDHSVGFAAAIMASLAEITMKFMLSEPKRKKHYAEAGFRAFWRAITTS
jgi:AcrR family transcriptional regulator